MINVCQQAIEDKKAGHYVNPDKRTPIYEVAWNNLADRAESLAGKR
ncbi:MAG: hypothetical protein M5U34_15110 [Chloroflexi bacterium]|nr:hypothetical protein [Chloroflexota bacterium]